MFKPTLLLYITLPLLFGFLGAKDTPKIVKSEWYQKLKKPKFNPPNFIFAPIWIYLYISTGYALYLVQYQVNDSNQNSIIVSTLGKWGIYAYYLQFILNILWSQFFFVQKEVDLALVDVFLLWAISLLASIGFFSVNSLAGTLMIPYILWATYAITLTYYVKKLNPDFKNPK